MKKKLLILLSMLLVFSMVFAACTPKEEEPAEPPAAEEPEAPAELSVGIVLPTKDEPRWIQDQTRFEAKLNETIERESSEALRYREIYDIDINDLSIYDLVIDSNRWNQYQICDILRAAIDNLGGFFNE